MDVEIFEIMDEIMELNHQITSYMVDFIKADMEGVTIKGEKISLEHIENNKIIKLLFERLQAKYRQLNDVISEKSQIPDKDVEGDLLYDMDLIKTFNINDLEIYLESSYMNLRYVSIYDNNGMLFANSIYDDKNFENLRTAEYNLQKGNLESIALRSIFNQERDALSFNERAYVLDDVSIKKFYKKNALSQIQHYINILEKNHSKMEQSEYERQRRGLYEQKYIIIYAYLNSKYNGIIQENDIGKFAVIKKFIDDNALEVILNMSKYEIDKNIEENIKENKQILRNNIKNICRSKKGKNTKKQNKQKQDKEISISDEMISQDNER